MYFIIKGDTMINKEKALAEFVIKTGVEKKDILIQLFEKMLIYKPEINNLILIINNISESDLEKYDIILNNSYNMILNSIETVDEINEKESIEAFEKTNYVLREIKNNEVIDKNINEQDLENILNQI